MTVALYYQILLSASLIYGGAIVFKILIVFAMEKMMPAIDDPSDRAAARATKAKTLLAPPKKQIWMGFAVILLLNGLVQLLPPMALQAHASLMRLPYMADQGPLYGMMSWWAATWGSHPVFFNIGSGFLQVSLGLFLWMEPGTIVGRIFLALTLLWGLFVWSVGEAFGNLVTRHFSWLNGSPGAGLLVAVIAIALLMPYRQWVKPQFASSLRWGWVVFWAVGGLWQLLPIGGFWTGSHLASLFPVYSGIGQPALIMAPIYAVKSAALHDPALGNLLWSAGLLGMGVFGLFPKLPNWGLVVGGVGLFFLWWVGQDFGLAPMFGLQLNTAPLLGLGLYALWQPAKNKITRPSSKVAHSPSSAHSTKGSVKTGPNKPGRR